MDRNRKKAFANDIEMESPSSRRAWIEIEIIRAEVYKILVALLAEGVDRNALIAMGIDIIKNVALLAEGVDRNSEAKENICDGICRPPRGGRG